MWGEQICGKELTDEWQVHLLIFDPYCYVLMGQVVAWAGDSRAQAAACFLGKFYTLGHRSLPNEVSADNFSCNSRFCASSAATRCVRSRL